MVEYTTYREIYDIYKSFLDAVMVDQDVSNIYLGIDTQAARPSGNSIYFYIENDKPMNKAFLIDDGEDIKASITQTSFDMVTYIVAKETPDHLQLANRISSAISTILNFKLQNKLGFIGSIERTDESFFETGRNKMVAKVVARANALIKDVFQETFIKTVQGNIYAPYTDENGNIINREQEFKTTIDGVE